jgi:hypothetical protein
MKELEAMLNESDRIFYSIEKITNLEQVKATYNWINIFEKRFGCLNEAEILRTKLRNIEL